MTEQFPSVPQGDETRIPAQPYGAHDPWNRRAETVSTHSGGVPADDHVIEFGGTEPGSPVAPVKPRKRRAFVLAASTVAVVLVGAGAYAGVRAWTGSGNTEPESVTPASVSAFARVDFNPGVRDKLAFDNLVKKFPTNGKSTTDVLTGIETDAAKAAGLDYNTDVKPWFDGRVGVAAWTDATGHPVGIVTLASKDDAKAKDALAKVQAAKGGTAKFGFVLKGGYALIALADADAQADATAAANEAAAHNLAGNGAFQSATSKTGDHNLLVAYLDMHRLGALMTKAMAGALGSIDPRIGPAQGLFGGATDKLDKLTGTYAVGAHITDDGIEIQVHGQGLDPNSMTTGPANVRPTLDTLPGNSIVALATAGLDPASDAAKQLGTTLDSLFNGSGGLPGGIPGAGGGLDPQVTMMLGQLSPVLQKILTAKVISFALTGITGTPAASINVQAQSAKDASDIFGPLQQLLSAAPSGVLSLKQDGDTVRAAFGPAGTGRLSDSPLYRKAMAGMDNAQFAAFIDLQAIFDATRPSPAQAADLPPLSGIGVFAHMGTTTADVMTRVIVSK